MNINYHSTFKK